ncbi:MAG: hypothetical protein HKN51_16195 [Saprospiraceae bacterium]|nr:hypothetical protein [Saprospiraceae bacterium]
MKTFVFVLSILWSLTMCGQNTWSTPLNIGTSHHLSNPSLTVVNGYPAICYRDVNDNIMYVRALDVCGNNWGTAINISSLYIANITSVSSPDLIIVDGHPAICFQDDSNLTFVYCRADDLDGSAWTQFKVVDSGNVIGRKCEMMVVNGNPAIVYNEEKDFCNGDIKYVRAADAQGNSWNSPIVLAGKQCTSGSQNIVNIQILNGHPSASIQMVPSAASPYINGIYFTRALDVDGNSWATPELVYPDGACLGHVVVDNKPHVLVRIADNGVAPDSLVIAVSSDTLGAIWPGILDSIDFGSSSTYFGSIYNFDNTVYVIGVNRDNSLDSISLISAPATAPLNFGPKELIRGNISFLSPHDFNSVCGELAAVFRNTDFYYTRTETMVTYYLDSDMDGFGDPNVSMTTITPPSGYVTDDTDCDDSDPNITQVGTPCDDGNACSTGTTLQPDCTCGGPTMVTTTVNTYVGSNDIWMDADNWSLNMIPDVCHDVVIPANKSVKIFAGEVANCFTLNLHASSTLTTDLNGDLHVITLGY